MIKVWSKSGNCKWEFKKETPPEKNEYNKGDIIRLTNWKSKINIQKPYFKREKPKKGIKYLRAERHDIKEAVTKAKFQICYDRIIEIVNEKIIKAHQKIRVPYNWIIKLIFYYFIYLII